LVDASNPFVRYRTRLDSYGLAMDLGWDDARFVALVDRLDAAVAGVDGHGFVITPFTEEPDLAATLGMPGALYVKDDTRNVSGSHKARHLFGVALHQAVQADVARGDGSDGELAIASCGNAALAAAVVARAAQRPLRVFIPTWADEAVVHRLEALGAQISVESRRPGEVGDPTYLRFLEAVDAGAVPFSVQGTVTPATIDGGRTMGWELADQLVAEDVTGIVRVFIQIGGGALAAATWAGLLDGIEGSGIEPVLHAVQTESCAPLSRAWGRLTEGFGGAGPRETATAVIEAGRQEELVARAEADPDQYMWAWDPVGMSAASGILDDVTYDWLPVVAGMLRSGGWPIVVPESDVVAAHAAVHSATDIDADATGTAGLAGMLAADRAGDLADGGSLVALVTGVTR
jgi:threonine synthase